MIVIDASVFLPAIAESGATGDLARDRIRDETLGAPELIDLETGAGLKRLERSGRLEGQVARNVFLTVGRAPLERFPHWPFLERIWELRHNLSIYDASYVALAEALGTVLVTADRAMGEAPGIYCEVELLALP